MIDARLDVIDTTNINLNIELFRLSIDLDEQINNYDLRVLSLEEINQAIRYAKREDKLRFIRTRATLRRLLQERLEIPINKIDFVRNSHGKPSLPKIKNQLKQEWHFNVSHCEEYALIALSPKHQLGIDIEYCRALNNQSELEQMVYSKYELNNITKLDFYACWTAKEAVLKAIGLGIGQHLQSVSIIANESNEPNWLEVRSTAIDSQNIQVCTLSVVPKYAAALAWLRE